MARPHYIKSNLHSVVAVLRVQNETGKVSGQVQASEIPDQVPEDDGMLAEELVGVNHLDGERTVVRTEQQTPQHLDSDVGYFT